MNKINCGGFYLGDGLKLAKDENGNPVLSADIDIPVELPAYTVADAGKVLQVGVDGKLAWVTLE